MKIFKWVLLGLMLTPIASRSDDLGTLAEARKITDKAVALFAAEKFAEGYGLLKPYWPLAAVEIDGLANQTNTQWPMVKQRFGPTVRTEFVSQMEGGSSFARFIYLQKFENHAIRWVFTFYKPKERWIVNGVSFDDQIQLLFH